MRLRRLGFGLLVSFFTGALFAIGCSDDPETPPFTPSIPDASVDRRGTGSTGDPQTDDDDSTDDDDDDDTEPVKDAGKGRDANGPLAAGETCSFNHDCQLELRCECDGVCECKEGARGKGKPGEGCEDQFGCASGLCLEGPDDELLCSDECAKDEDCPEILPLCKNIASVGKFCARQPPP